LSFNAQSTGRISSLGNCVATLGRRVEEAILPNIEYCNDCQRPTHEVGRLKVRFPPILRTTGPGMTVCVCCIVSFAPVNADSNRKVENLCCQCRRHAQPRSSATKVPWCAQATAAHSTVDRARGVATYRCG
jgi:hypothetical protein